jgi:phytoene dehydrogenase-like protein
VHDTRDVVIVGGGHNGLVAAAYLALAGKSVTVVERLDHVGGAAVSAQAFEGVDAMLSRYSYLVSLLPASVIRDLRLDITLAPRRYSSYTPEPARGTASRSSAPADAGSGLLIDNADAAATATALGTDAAAWQQFYSGTAHLARALFPTVTEPLITRSEARRTVGDDALWESLVEHPIGASIADTFASDLVRGVVLTDALIGTFAPNVDESLAANRCFMYHVIGNGTGSWDVPVGGMGAVTGELYRAARAAGAEILTRAEVTSITPDGDVTFGDRTLHATWVLANVAPFELALLMGEEAERPEGAQAKVNLLVSRLPRLRDPAVDPAAAFGGTFHINETWSQLETAYATAVAGGVPSPLPGEIYCHSLTDPTILSPELRAAGAQTLTFFGLHVPDRLATEVNNDDLRARLQAAALASLDSVLAEPIEELLLRDAAGNPTIETKTTLDLEHALHMPGGNIFHGPLSWPFAEDGASLATPAERWGVATDHPRILLCGAGAQRGGAVSGLGGHNAAMAVLEAS